MPVPAAGQLQGTGWARLAQQPGRGRALGEAAHSSEGHRWQVSRACPTPPHPHPNLPSHLAQLNEDPVTETREIRGRLQPSESLGAEEGSRSQDSLQAPYRASHTAGALIKSGVLLDEGAGQGPSRAQGTLNNHVPAL